MKEMLKQKKKYICSKYTEVIFIKDTIIHLKRYKEKEGLLITIVDEYTEDKFRKYVDRIEKRFSKISENQAFLDYKKDAVLSSRGEGLYSNCNNSKILLIDKELFNEIYENISNGVKYLNKLDLKKNMQNDNDLFECLMLYIVLGHIMDYYEGSEAYEKYEEAFEELKELFLCRKEEVLELRQELVKIMFNQTIEEVRKSLEIEEDDIPF